MLCRILSVAIAIASISACRTASPPKPQKESAPIPPSPEAPHSIPLDETQPPSEPMRVLSYNICFECMTNRNTSSAGTLGAQCAPIAPGSRTTICAQNIAKLLENTTNAYGKLDFIALQEASRSDCLEQQYPILSTDYTKVWSKQDTEEMVTYYRKDRYHLEDKIESAFNKGRPLQILIFKEKLLFVNGHLRHKPVILEQVIHDKITAHLTAQGKNPDHYKEYRIIMAADFNSEKYKKIKFPPTSASFPGASLQTDLNFLKHTCCTTKVPASEADHHATYDYVLDSEKAHRVKVEVPHVYDWATPKSDHLPVIAILPPLAP